MVRGDGDVMGGDGMWCERGGGREREIGLGCVEKVGSEGV